MSERSFVATLYRWCLRLYPRGFRDAFGAEMEAAFQDALRDARATRGRAGVFALGLRTLIDVARSVPREHVDAWRGDPAHTVPDAGILELPGSGRRPIMSQWTEDLRWTVRSLRRQPAFSAIAILTLALGIGANTALFSVVRTVLLEPLPYGDPDRVAMIWSRWVNFDKTWVSEPEYHNYRATLASFEDLGPFNTFEVSITEGDEPERVPVSAVMPNVFEILGVSPLLGRTFREEEAQANGASTVVLGHEVWQRRYGGDASVVGRTMSINGQPFEILGVLPPGIRTPLDFRTDRPTQLWFPYALSVQPGPIPFAGGSHGSYAIGRLRAAATAEMANAELRALTQRLTEEGTYPQSWNFAAFAVTATAEVSGSLRPALLVLLGAVGLVLLIACVNVANLLLVRAEDRRAELAVRAAIGASGRRLVRQLLVENTVLGVAGGTVGIVLATAGLAAVRSLAPAGLPRVAEASIDAGVLGFTALLSLATAAIFGLIPALHAARADTRVVLAEGGRASSAAGGRHRVRRMLIAIEVALAVVLAIGAGLMLRSFWKLAAIEPGFDAENVLTMRVSTPSAYYPDDADVTGFYARLLEGVRALPGVREAGVVRLLPIDQEIGDSCVTIYGYMPPENQCAAADWQAASDGYFEAIGQQRIAGRSFTAADTRDAPQVIVVNEEFVRRYFADGVAVGKPVRFGFTREAPDQTVVGVVADVRHNGLTSAAKPAFYRPHAQWAVSTGFPQRSVALVVRTNRDPRSFAGPVRGVVRSLDARLPVANVKTMDDVLARATAQPRFTLVLLVAFGGLALVLAVVGIYGVVSFAVASRSHELGIRMALGAGPRSVIWLSLRHGLTWALMGVGAGTFAGLAAARLLAGIVYEVPTHDPPTFAAVIALSLLVSLGASWLPARRASRADPLSAFRSGPT
ncbi:MAG: ABC transporter permease [Gemmatimonadetes bacterium]|nr:ABC transporter permease [Gemmatimonadota bacterium]